MVEVSNVRKPNLSGGTKVKTGCATCRIRRVKCDENKPFCRKCVSTGRICDGYSLLFKSCPGRPVRNVDDSDTNTDLILETTRRTSTEVGPQEIDLLSRCLSTKSLFNVDLGCNEEARQLLQASLTDPSIHHAITSLKYLRKEFELSCNQPAFVSQRTSGYNYGLRQYSVALKGLVCNLSSSSSDALRSALLCCQLFISIEQVQGHFATMIQHIIRGLSIMRECRPRPALTPGNKLEPARHDQLPLLDVFVIKLFAAPCKFAEPPATTDMSGTVSSTSYRQQTIESRRPTIAPNMRTELARIATLTLEFLVEVERVKPAVNVPHLLSKRATLLGSLGSWLADLELAQTEKRSSYALETVSVSFLRLFRSILRLILLGTLDSSSDLHAELQAENEQLRTIADSIDERLKAFRMRSGPGNDPRSRITIS